MIEPWAGWAEEAVRMAGGGEEHFGAPLIDDSGGWHATGIPFRRKVSPHLGRGLRLVVQFASGGEMRAGGSSLDFIENFGDISRHSYRAP